MLNSKEGNKFELDKRNNGKVAFYVFCVWIFVLLSRPQDLFHFLIPLRPALVTSTIALVAFINSQKYLPTQPLLQSSQIKKYLLLYAVMFIGIPYSIHVRVSFDRIITDYIIIVLFVIVFYKIVFSIERLYKVLQVVCLGAGLYTFIALLNYVSDSGRLSYGKMFDPNDLAYFTIGFLPLFFLFFSKNNTLIIRLMAVTFYSAGVLIILLSGSRGGLLAFVSSMLILLLITKTIRRSIKTLVLCCCAVFVALAPVNFERYSTILNLEEDYNVTAEGGRIDLWKIGLKSLMENPLTGVGVGCYSIAVGHDRKARDASTRAWQTAHNSVVQIGTETGIFGLLLYLMLCFNNVNIFLTVRKYSEDIQMVKIAEMSLVGFTGLFIAGLFVSQGYSAYWAFYVGLSAVVSQQFDKSIITQKK